MRSWFAGNGTRFANVVIGGLGATYLTFRPSGALSADPIGARTTDRRPVSTSTSARPRLLVPHLRRPSAELWADVALAAMVTHHDPTSTSACLAFARILWDLPGGPGQRTRLCMLMK